MIYGTHYFPTRADIFKYYGGHCSGDEISRKIKSKEVAIGEPPNQSSTRRAFLKADHGGSLRWFISEDVSMKQEIL